MKSIETELADAFVLLWSSDDRAAWDKKAAEHFDALLAKVESGYLAPTAIPEGYVLMPKEPTHEIFDALFLVMVSKNKKEMVAAYKEMLAAGEKK